MKSFYLQMQEAFTLLADKFHTWLNEIILITPNMVIAIIIMALVYFSARGVKNISTKLLRKLSAEPSVISLLSNIITIAFVTLGLFLALHVINLDKAVTSLLAGAGLIGLAVGLAFQEPIINTISGILMTFKKPYKVGDLVESNGFMGFIEQIDLRMTYVKLFSGQLVVIPNKLVIQNPLKNYTILGVRRVEMACGISYADDLEMVKDTAVKAIEENLAYDKSKPVEFFYTEFGDSSINFSLRFWLDLCQQPDYLKAKSDAVIAIKKAFDREGITIPFPIRTLDFKEHEQTIFNKIADASLKKVSKSSKSQMVASDN